MDNLNIFYEVLYGHLLPLTDNPENYSKYLSYLKDEFPEWKKHYKVRLERTKSHRYKIINYQEFYFHELDNMIYYKGKQADDPNAYPLAEKVCPELGISPENIFRTTCEIEKNQVHLELTIEGRYDDLSPQQARFYYYRVMLDNAVQDIRKKLHEKVNSFDTQNQVRLQIRKYQASIHAYMKTVLHDYLPKQEQSAIYQLSGDYSTIDIFKVVYHNLEELLVYLENSFFHYLDLDATAPYRNRLVFAIANKNDAEGLIEKLGKIKISSDLRNIITAPLKTIINKNKYAVSYKSLAYHEDFVKAFVDFFKQKPSIDEQAILGLLCSLDFNALQFFRYLTGRITRQVNNVDPLLEKLDILYYQQKLHNQTVIRTAYPYKSNVPSLKEQVVAWLDEEIAFWKRKLKYQAKESVLTPAIRQSQAPQKEVLRLSVPQISLISRLFYETGNIEGTRKESLRFVSRNYSTIYTMNISPESLSKKYYQVTEQTKQVVRGVLMQMLDYLNEPTNFS